MFNKKVIFGAVVIALVLLLYIYLLFTGIGYKQQAASTQKANLDVLPAESIPTVNTDLLIITPTSTQPPQPEFEGVGVQKFVKIEGTGGVGLRIRREPGTSTDVVFIANESEVFIVIGGPVEKDGILWWQLTTPYDESRNGWASSDYLTMIEEN
jgi:hypothetical protein